MAAFSRGSVAAIPILEFAGLCRLLDNANIE